VGLAGLIHSQIEFHETQRRHLCRLGVHGYFAVLSRKVDVRLPGKGNSKLPWRETGPLNHLDDVMDSDQWVVNRELSLSSPFGVGRQSATHVWLTPNGHSASGANPPEGTYANRINVIVNACSNFLLFGQLLTFGVFPGQ